MKETEILEPIIDETAPAKVKKNWTFWTKLNFFRNLAIMGFYIAYVIFFLVEKQGNAVVNYVLMISTVLYSVIFLVAAIFFGRKGRKFSGATKRMYKVIRRLMLLFNTVLTGGSILNSVFDGSSTFMKVCALVIIVNLIFNITWLLLSSYFERKFQSKIEFVKGKAREYAKVFKNRFWKRAPAKQKKDAIDVIHAEAEKPPTEDLSATAALPERESSFPE